MIRLPGQQYDAEKGLYYNLHRYYDPVQFIDPLGLNGWQALQKHLNQPVNQSALLKAMYENTKGTKPVSLRSDGHPQGYGCGDESTDRYVPDSLYGVSLLPACRIHDKCYLAASLYQVAVEQAGEGAYNAAQKEAAREPVFK